MSQTSPFYFSFFIEYENYAQQEEWEEGGGGTQGNNTDTQSEITGGTATSG